MPLYIYLYIIRDLKVSIYYYIYNTIYNISIYNIYNKKRKVGYPTKLKHYMLSTTT